MRVLRALLAPQSAGSLQGLDTSKLKSELSPLLLKPGFVSSCFVKEYPTVAASGRAPAKTSEPLRGYVRTRILPLSSKASPKRFWLPFTWRVSSKRAVEPTLERIDLSTHG